MYLVEVIPATKIPLTQSQVYTYYTSLKLQRGSLVSIFVNRRLIEGLVIESRDLTKEKMSVKRLSYELKSINKILFAGEFFSNNYIELIKWMADYYRIPLGLSLKTFLPKHPKKLISAEKETLKRNSADIPGLTPDFNNIFNRIKEFPGDVLLHNRAGKNLSVLYANLISNAIKNNKQALILEPEIALAKDFYSEMQKYFGKDTVFLHKELSLKKYWGTWQKIKNNEIKIIIGTRSAIFAPVENLGLMILKNEHSPSYKNWDQQPRYHAKDIAAKLAEKMRAKIIYESITPSIETYYKATEEKMRLVEIDETKNKRIPVEIIDMREEMRKKNFSVISENLKTEISGALEKKEKIILFINRRGAATAVICRDCGLVIKCPACDVPMAYHSFAGKKDRLVCHYCDSDSSVPLLCPKCQSHRIKYIGAGTQKVAEAVSDLFPEAKIQRIDSDAAKEDETLLISDLGIKNADILIGTQMIINKGIDKKFALAGVINTDIMLHLPDFRAGEKTFQLLYQLGNMAEKMLIQTYNPENIVIRSAADRNYGNFFKKEIEDRKIFSYPPFSELIKLAYAHKDSSAAKKEARLLAFKLSDSLEKMPGNGGNGIEILGPAPAYVYKMKNRYIWRIIIKIKNDSGGKIKNLLLKSVPSDWMIDVNPISLL